jgi:hypothetical protein
MTPHAPQLFGSVVTLLQPVAQHDSPPVHNGPPAQVVIVVQIEFAQSPVGQTTPQAPQLVGSVTVLVQPFAQQDSPPTHAGPPAQVGCVVQDPFTQTPPAAQTMPQPPQLFESLSVDVHPVEQQL